MIKNKKLSEKEMITTEDLKMIEDKASQKPIKQDFSKQCNMDDDDENNPCWQCIYFLFPIGCMFGEE